jgi:hypothetical protein
LVKADTMRSNPFLPWSIEGRRRLISTAGQRVSKGGLAV